MCWLLILAFVVLTVVPVAAEPLQIAPERVSAVVSADWNDDGGRDRALLVETEDDVNLLIYLSTGEEYSEAMELHTRATDIVTRSHGFMTDQPTLALSSEKNLKLTASHLAFGRYPWESTLTIAFKDGVFLVTGYTYMTHDRLKADGGNCEVNLLTGRGTRNGKAVRIARRAVPVTEWGEAKVPTECRNFVN